MHASVGGGALPVDAVADPLDAVADPVDPLPELALGAGAGELAVVDGDGAGAPVALPPFASESDDELPESPGDAPAHATSRTPQPTIIDAAIPRAPIMTTPPRCPCSNVRGRRPWHPLQKKEGGRARVLVVSPSQT